MIELPPFQERQLSLSWPGKQLRKAVPAHFPELRETDGTPNSMLMQGEVLSSLGGLLKQQQKCELIYLDPPYFSGATYRQTLRNRSGKRLGHQPAYSDRGSRSEYLQLMHTVLRALHALLSDSGSILVHCDWHASHQLRQLLEEVFGEEHFLNELIWSKGAGGQPKGALPRKHDSIFWFAKQRQHFSCFDSPLLRTPYDESTLHTHYHKQDETGRHYRDQVVNGKRYRSYADVGKRITDVWTDIGGQHATSPISPESTGYPTQKPLKLMRRLITMACPEGGTLLDPFCGSGSSLVGAAELGRKAIGIDRNPVALRLSQRRLRSVGSLVSWHSDENHIPIGLNAQRVGDQLNLTGVSDPPFSGHWQQLVNSVAIDLNWDGNVFRPEIFDIPVGKALVQGSYALPTAEGRVCAQAVLIDGSLRWWCSS